MNPPADRPLATALDFVGTLAELWQTAQSAADLDGTLRVVCERAGRLLESDAVIVRVLEGDRLVVRAMEPAVGGGSWSSLPIDHPTAAAARAAASGLPVLSEELGEIPPGLAAVGIRRVLALPLVGPRGRVLGTFSLGDVGGVRDVGAWKTRAALLATLLAATVGGALDREALHEESARTETLLRAIGELGRVAPCSELLVGLCRLGRTLLRADRVAVFAWDARTRGFVSVADDEAGASEVERRVPGPLALVPAGERVVWGEERGTGEGRLLASPLLHAGRAYGMLSARLIETRGRFDARHATLLEALARQGGVALDDLRLRQEASGSIASATLVEFTEHLDQAGDVRAIATGLAVRAASLTGAHAALVTVTVDGEARLRVEALHGLPATEAERLLGLELPAGIFGGGDRVRLQPAWCARLAAAMGEEPGSVAEVSLAIERGRMLEGFLTLAWGRGESAPTQSLAVAHALTALAATALHNVRLVEDVERARRLKSEFVATMSHELRTPLNVVMGYNDLLLEGAFGDLGTEVNGVLERTQKSARELLALITATLDLSRLESGESPPRVEPVSVPELFDELRSGTTTADRPYVEVDWSVAPDLAMLQTDRGKLATVLRNLIDNAIKFTQQGRISIAAERQNGDVVFTVTDSGIGIDEKDMPVIFELFRQVESAHTRRHGGTGLGLYMVKRLLMQLRGEIDVKSALGSGSRFRVRLPAPGDAD